MHCESIYSEVIALWSSTRPFIAQDALKLLGQENSSETAVVSFAIEEYLGRIQRGEKLPISEFAARFPRVHHTLMEVLPRAVSYIVPEDPDWPEIGDVCHGFLIDKLIGSGRFSRVYLARELAIAERVVVIKATISTFNELPALARMQHPAISQIYSVHHDETSGLTYIAMPFLGKSTLLDWISLKPQLRRGARLKSDFGLVDNADYQRRSVAILADAAEGIEFAHRCGVVHGDIKPPNILVSDMGKAVVIDFNGANVSGDTSLALYTLPFTAPELVESLVTGDNSGFVLNRSTDSFAFGMTAVHVLQGLNGTAFEPDGTLGEWLKTVKSNRYRNRVSLDLVPKSVREELREIIFHSLAADPSSRISDFTEIARTFRNASDVLRANAPVRKGATRKLLVTAAIAGLSAAAIAHAPTGLIFSPADEGQQVASVQAASWLSHNRSAVKLLRARRWEDAESELRQAMSESPRNPVLIVNQTFLLLARSQDDSLFIPNQASAREVLEIQHDLGYGPFLEASVLATLCYERSGALSDSELEQNGPGLEDTVTLVRRLLGRAVRSGAPRHAIEEKLPMLKNAECIDEFQRAIELAAGTAAGNRLKLNLVP